MQVAMPKPDPLRARGTHKRHLAIKPCCTWASRSQVASRCSKAASETCFDTQTHVITSNSAMADDNVYVDGLTTVGMSPSRCPTH
eukprot:15142094-Alexandrium_andersonii.AAC.1